MPLDELAEVFGPETSLLIADAVGELSPEIENYIVQKAFQMKATSQVFGTKLEKQVGLLIGNGLSVKNIKANITKDLVEGGKIFGELRNNVKSELTDITNVSARMGQLETQGDKEIFTWTTVGGHRICPDCAGRAGDQGTYSYWIDEGVPCSGWSYCGGNCYCVLDSSGKLPAQVVVGEVEPEKGFSKS